MDLSKQKITHVTVKQIQTGEEKIQQHNKKSIASLLVPISSDVCIKDLFSFQKAVKKNTFVGFRTSLMISNIYLTTRTLCNEDYSKLLSKLNWVSEAHIFMNPSVSFSFIKKAMRVDGDLNPPAWWHLSPVYQ